MSTNNKPILVIITSTKCPSCVGFKKDVLPALKYRLTMVEPVIIELNGDKGPLANYPADLAKHIHWYPIILLIDRRLWEKNRSQSTPLQPLVFNGKKDARGQFYYASGESGSFPRTAAGIIDWINSHMKNDVPTVVVTQSGKPISSYSTRVQRLKTNNGGRS